MPLGLLNLLPEFIAGRICVTSASENKGHIHHFAPFWCIMVNEELIMLDKKPAPSRTKETVRASISFNSGDYEQLERLATEKKVSLAWVVREAVSHYIQDDTQDAQTPANKG